MLPCPFGNGASISRQGNHPVIASAGEYCTKHLKHRRVLTSFVKLAQAAQRGSRPGRLAVSEELDLILRLTRVYVAQNGTRRCPSGMTRQPLTRTPRIRPRPRIPRFRQRLTQHQNQFQDDEQADERADRPDQGARNTAVQSLWTASASTTAFHYKYRFSPSAAACWRREQTGGPHHGEPCRRRKGQDGPHSTGAG